MMVFIFVGAAPELPSAAAQGYSLQVRLPDADASSEFSFTPPNDALGLRPADDVTFARSVLLAGSITASALGIIFTGLGIAEAQELLDPVMGPATLNGCFAFRNTPSTWQWARLGGSDCGRRTGIPAVPLGLGLATLGAGMTTAVLLTDDHEVPWLWSAISFAAGTLVTTVALLVEPSVNSGDISMVGM